MSGKRVVNGAVRILGADRPPVAGLLALVAAIDIPLIGFHVSAHTLGYPGGFVFDLAADRGYSEFFQYMKTLWAGLLLAYLAVRRRALIFAAWALTCVYLFVDDAFMLHEQAGWAVRDAVPGRPGWAVHVGEAAFLGVVGLILITVVFVAHRRARIADRTASLVLVALFGVMILFGVVIDTIHHLLFPGPDLRLLFTVIEDGGEMLTLSLIVAFAFAVALCGHEPHSRLSADEPGTLRASDADPIEPSRPA